VRRNRHPALLLVALVGTFVGALSLGGCADAPRRRPNVVLILVDDLGYADLGVQGSPDVVSPNIDSLAEHGVRFTAGYVTSPQCSPSRAGLLTGRYPNRFGFEYNFAGYWDKGLDPKEHTLADYLRTAGYATGMVGKWHLGQAERFQPGRRGFSESLWHPSGGIYFPDPATGTLPGMRRGAEPADVSGYSTDAFTDAALAFVERHRDEPFFLYLSYVAPHWPMEPKPEILERFEHVEGRHRRAFLALLASLDENVGRLLDRLRTLGLEEDTLIFFLSDNGGAGDEPGAAPDAPLTLGRNASSNAPFRGDKRDLLEGGIRIPFLLQWKRRLPAGLRYDEPVISLDVLPTALAAAGVPVDPAWHLDGVDLIPFLTGERAGPPHEALYWRFNFLPLPGEPRRWAIRAGRWKLVRNAREPLALYDLEADPGERNDLAAREPERVAALRARWKRWNAEMRPPAWPVKNAVVRAPAATAPPGRDASDVAR
jgi:arylsulfatase A-like enzyme